MNFLELALNAAVEKFLDEIEPEIQEFKTRLETIRGEFLQLAKELSDLVELFKRHLVATKLAEDDLRARLFQLESQAPKNELNADESSRKD